MYCLLRPSRCRQCVGGSDRTVTCPVGRPTTVPTLPRPPQSCLVKQAVSEYPGRPRQGLSAESRPVTLEGPYQSAALVASRNVATGRRAEEEEECPKLCTNILLEMQDFEMYTFVVISVYTMLLKKINV